MWNAQHDPSQIEDDSYMSTSISATETEYFERSNLYLF